MAYVSTQRKLLSGCLETGIFLSNVYKMLLAANVSVTHGKGRLIWNATFDMVDPGARLSQRTAGHIMYA